MAGTISTLIAVALWSFHATAGDLAIKGISAIWLTLIAYGAGLLVLLIIVSSSSIPGRQCVQHLGRPLLTALLLSGPVMMLYYLALYKGMSLASAVNVYIIHYLWPIFAAICVRLTLRRSWGTRGSLPWILMAIAFAGAGMVVLSGHSMQAGSAPWQGYACALVSAVCGGLYLPALVLAGDRLTAQGYTHITAFLIPYILLLGGGLVAIMAYLPFSGMELTLSPTTLLWTLFIGLGIIVLAEMAWVFGIRWQRSQATSALAYLTPVFSTLLLVLIVHEPLPPLTIAGISVIVGANLLLHMASRRSRGS